MNIPDPALADEIAQSLVALADATRAAAGELAALGRSLRAGWQGHAAAAAEQLVGALAVSSGQTADALEQAAGAWWSLGDDLRIVQRRIRMVDAVGDGATIWAVVSALQAGLDPVTDAAAAGTGAAAVTGMAAAHALLRGAVERLVAKALADRAALAALRAYVIQAVAGVTKAAVSTAGLDEFEYGHVHISDVLNPGLAEALVPTLLQAALIGGHADPLILAGTPAAFAGRGSYAAAVDAADAWAATEASGALVSVHAGPDGDGVQLTVSGGGVAGAVGAQTRRPPGHPYTAEELQHVDPSLAALLEAMSGYAYGPVSVVLR